MTHICVGKLTFIGSDNGLSPGRRQAIIWTNAGLSLIKHLGTYFTDILIGIQTFSFKKMHLKMSSAKWRPFCLGLNVLKVIGLFMFQLTTNRAMGYRTWNCSAALTILSNVLLMEFQIRIVSHIATTSIWINALFAVQIQVCQSVVEPSNLAGCVIYIGHVRSIACFIINILKATFVTKNCRRLFKLTIIYTRQQNMSPHTTRTFWSAGGLNNSHTCDILSEPTA